MNQADPDGADSPALTDEDRDQHQWQLDVPDFGEAGQERLKSATVLISRIGGLGGPVAWELAAAGVGRLILAHFPPLSLSHVQTFGGVYSLLLMMISQNQKIQQPTSRPTPV